MFMPFRFGKFGLKILLNIKTEIKMKKISVVVFLAVLLGFGLSSFVSRSLGDWPVPDKNKKMANPVKSDAASIAEGKTLLANIALHVMVNLGMAMVQKLHN